MSIKEEYTSTNDNIEVDTYLGKSFGNKYETIILLIHDIITNY